MIRVYLLGQFAIEGPGGEIILPTTKVRLLAAYLFWKQGRWVTREALRALLWGDCDEERAAGNLRTALYSLRRSLVEGGAPGNLLEVRRLEVRVTAGPDCLVDVRLFEEYAWAGLRTQAKTGAPAGGQVSNEGVVESLMAAASLYRGDLLEDLDADFCLADRRRLADLYLAVLRALVERLAADGLHEAAVSYASRWLAADPLDQGAHQALMRLYSALGQPARVIEQFDECRRTLQAELGLPPGEATVRLFRELAGRDPEDPGWQGCQPGGQDGVRRRAAEKLSEAPLRSARFLLFYGEDQAAQGDVTEAVTALEKAVRIYDRFGTGADRAKARLLVGKALLRVPVKPDGSKVLVYITPALDYYRSHGPPGDLVQALLVAANAYWLCLQTSEAAALAREGLVLADALGDKEAEGLLALALGVALRDAFRLEEAEAAFERAVQAVPHLSDAHETLWLALQRGILAALRGELSVAESFLREALTLGRLVASPSPRMKQGELMARSVLLGVLHYREDRRGMEALVSPSEAEEYLPEPLAHLNSLYLRDADARVVLAGLAGWLRVRLGGLNPSMAAYSVRAVVEKMLASGLTAEAARWAAVGVRVARSQGWPAGAALFYCHRAVALLRMGRPEAAALCRRRAEAAADKGDLWTPAWSAWVDGLIALAEGDPVVAKRHLRRSRSLFLRIGSRHDARQVEQAEAAVDGGNRF